MNRWIARNRVPILANGVVVCCIVAAWVAYAIFGHSLVASMYRGQSIGFLNAMITGRDEHSLATYLHLADRAMRSIALMVLAASLATTIVIRTDRAVLRRFASAAALVIASLTVSLLAAEWGVRVVYRNVTTTGDNSSYFVYRWIAAHPPARNHWGFREREFADRPDDGRFRIAVIGDSFTWGQGIPEEDRVTNMLQRTLNESQQKFEVLNFGRCGAETADELNYLRDVVLKVSPDFILVQWYINDVEEPDHAKRPVPWPLPLPEQLRRRLHKSSALYYLAEDAWWRTQAALGIGETYEQYLRRRFLNADGADSRAAYGLLGQLIAEIRDRGIPMGIVIYPDLRYDPAPGRPYSLGFLLDRVMSSCASAGIPCVDLRPTLVKVRPPRRLWVSPFDDHPNRLANELVAGAILNTFQDSWTAPGSHGTR